MPTIPFGRAVCGLALCLLAAGCVTGCVARARTSFEAQEQWTFPFSVEAVDQVLPGVMDGLAMAIVEREFDGAVGYVRARTPAGAVIQVGYETMTPQKTYVRVHATRKYGYELANTVMYELYEAAERAAERGAESGR